MACILDKFSNAVKREDISSKVIWDRLDTMYDMQALVRKLMNSQIKYNALFFLNHYSSFFHVSGRNRGSAISK